MGIATSQRSNIEHEWSTVHRGDFLFKRNVSKATLPCCAPQWRGRAHGYATSVLLYLSNRLQPGMWIPARHCKVTIQLPLAKSK